MPTNDFLNTIKRFDAYPKTLEDFRVKTLVGGTGSFCLIHYNYCINNSMGIMYFKQLFRKF